MGRYSTLNEDVQRINTMAGVQTKPPCGCEKPEDDKEIITSSAMEEGDVAAQRDKFFADLEAEAGQQMSKVPVTGVAPDLNPNPQHWNEAVDLYNRIRTK